VAHFNLALLLAYFHFPLVKIDKIKNFKET